MLIRGQEIFLASFTCMLLRRCHIAIRHMDIDFIQAARLDDELDITVRNVSAGGAIDGCKDAGLVTPGGRDARLAAVFDTALEVLERSPSVDEVLGLVGAAA